MPRLKYLVVGILVIAVVILLDLIFPLEHYAIAKIGQPVRNCGALMNNLPGNHLTKSRVYDSVNILHVRMHHSLKVNYSASHVLEVVGHHR
jgi:hypothetical protein